MNTEDILKKLDANEPLTEAEKDYFINQSMKGLVKGQPPKGENLSIDAFTKLFDVYKDFQNSPQSRQMFRTIASERNADRLTRRMKPFFNSLLQGADIVTSLSQIRSADRATRALVKPNFAPQIINDPVLAGEIAKAQAGTFDQARALAPAQQAIREARTSGRATARAASGGQAGTFASMEQQNNINQMRAGVQLPMVADQVRRGQQAHLATLLGLSGQQAAQNSVNALRSQQMAVEQYGNDAKAAALLGATGRTNLRGTFSTLPDNLLGAAGRLLPVQSLGGTGAPTIGQESPYSSYFNQLKNNFASTVQNLQNSFRRRTSRYEPSSMMGWQPYFRPED